MALPADIKKTIEMCRHCFMCRHANPTFLVTKLDAHTPRGYALGLSRIEEGLAEWSEDLAAKLFGSTLDGLCSESCEFHWREDLVVQAGRTDAVRHGLAPAAVAHAARRRLVKDPGAFPAPPIGAERLDRVGAEVLLLTGLDARERAPETISATAAILDDAGVYWTALSVETDPGIDLWELGYGDEAAEAAESFVATVERLHPARLVTGSARVARAVREPLPAELAGLPRLEHLSEFLVARADLLEAAGTTVAGSGAIAYHDPCSLGRRLRVFDEPRAVIESVSGVVPLEFPHHGAEAECCGEGGLLPEVDPELASRMARVQLGRVPGTATMIVTADPGCKAQLAGMVPAGLTVTDLSELVAGQLGARPELAGDPR